MTSLDSLYAEGLVIIYTYNEYNDLCQELNKRKVKYRREVSTTSAKERIWAIELIKEDN